MGRFFEGCGSLRTYESRHHSLMESECQLITGASLSDMLSLTNQDVTARKHTDTPSDSVVRPTRVVHGFGKNKGGRVLRW